MYYAGPILDCNGDCLNDSDGDGICDENENECPDYNGNGICDNLDAFGCTYPDACNYDASATADDGSRTYAANGFNCDGTSIDGSNSFAGCPSTSPELQWCGQCGRWKLCLCRRPR